MKSKRLDHDKVSLSAVVVWSLCTLYFFYEFFVNVVLGTFAKAFIHDLSLSTVEFSIIASASFLIYGLMQIPVGILVDRFGPRVILTSASFICTIGVYIVSVAYSFPTALIGRLFIGFGSSFAFVSILVVSMQRFPRKYFGMLTGLTQFIGGMGPVIAGGPFAAFLTLFGGKWRETLVVIATIGVCISVAIFLFVRRAKKQDDSVQIVEINASIGKDLLILARFPRAWFAAIINTCLYISLPLLGAFWGTYYLETIGFSLSIGASIVSSSWLGYAISCPIYGIVSDRIKKRRPGLIFGSVLGIVSSTLIVYSGTTSAAWMTLFFVGLGVAASSMSLTYPIVSEILPSRISPAAVGFNNSIALLMTALFPILIGKLLEVYKVNGQITPFTFQEAFLIIPVLYVIALFFCFTVSETYCRENKLHILDREDL